MSVLLNVAFVGSLIATAAGSASRSASLVTLIVNTQFTDHVKRTFISLLIDAMDCNH